jgi:hypothetical protein
MFHPSTWSLAGRDDLPPDLLAAHNAATYSLSMVEQICTLAKMPMAMDVDMVVAAVQGLRRVLQEDKGLASRLATEFDEVHHFQSLEFWDISDSNVHSLAMKLASRLRNEIWSVADFNAYIRAPLDASIRFDVETIRKNYEAVCKHIIQLNIPSVQPLQALLNQEAAAVSKQRRIERLQKQGRKKSTPNKRGRRKDPEVARRRKKMVEAWQTGSYRTYVELAHAFEVDESEASRVIGEHNRRSRKAKSV